MRSRGLLVALASLLGCTAAPPPAVPLAGDVVTIFVPGIKGTFLHEPETGERVWLSAGDALVRGDRSLALPRPLVPGGPLTRFTFFPFVKEDVYLPWLEFGTEELPGFTPLGYDWRQDARDAVALLAARIEDLVRERPTRKFDLVGHSLGGLICYAYARAHPERVRKLVVVGAPFGGAPGFLRDIAEGDAVGRNVALLSAEAMRSFPSAYQLLPPEGELLEAPSGSSGEGELFAALVPSEPDRARLLEARRSFREGLAPASALPPILVVAGVGRPTIARVRTTASSPDWTSSPTTGGDGRVTEESAQPPPPVRFELVKTTADHVNLLNDAEVQRAIAAFLR